MPEYMYHQYNYGEGMGVRFNVSSDCAVAPGESVTVTGQLYLPASWVNAGARVEGVMLDLVKLGSATDPWYWDDYDVLDEDVFARVECALDEEYGAPIDFSLTFTMTQAIAERAGLPSYGSDTYRTSADLHFAIWVNGTKFRYFDTADPVPQRIALLSRRQPSVIPADSVVWSDATPYRGRLGGMLQNLSDVIPELYGMAQEQYQNEGNELRAQYAMIGDQRDTEYNKYRDALSDWNYNQQIARQLDADEYNRQTTAKQQAYANLYAMIAASGYVPSSAELAAAGMTQKAANALRTEFLRQTGQLPAPAVALGGGGGGGDYGGNRTLKQMADDLRKQGVVPEDINNAVRAYASDHGNSQKEVNSAIQGYTVEDWLKSGNQGVKCGGVSW